LQYAQSHEDVNMLGLDIRQACIDIATTRASARNLRNVKYIACNANVDIARILSDINSVSKVKLLAIQFPDPCFRKKHHKRRLVNESFVRALSSFLPQGGSVFLQSDVEETMFAAVEVFSQSAYFSVSPEYDVSKMKNAPNPTGVKTEREISVDKRSLDVFRILYTRNDKSVE
jgi:tRNA (guanine-N7-)-methyltransferase